MNTCDAVDRNLVKKDISRWRGYIDDDMIARMHITIDKLPPATSQQKVGSWIPIENEDMEIIGYFCSNCDLPMETEEKTVYCPTCGSKNLKGDD